ncbi:hypothetical protein WT81_27950 [Burkholderia stagnalis]|uniref:hypothetical protein n=1 Tax=Burkholderia stagnalis TaxID=1503054 RepID=UPI00075FE358|nr:hypothetical protein [Burkholderia stagnalis]KWK51288.1 hypothetical protein WT81_27950 [Burkholderia stagnalis]KWK53107.1 hypothetical protein WT80_08370 [Burkholderia stagnalis]
MSHATFRSESGYRAMYQTATGAPATSTASRAVPDTQALVALAREAGMLVMLDAQIGRERYESVSGSLAALERFAQALQAAIPRAA